MCVASAAYAAVQTPFHGDQDAEFYYTGSDGEYVDVVVFGTGHYTHMGLTTFESQLTVNLITGFGVGTSVYVAANGDELWTEFTSQATSATDRYYEVTTVGGTGRFEGATGFSTGYGVITSSDETGGTGDAWFSGTISY